MESESSDRRFFGTSPVGGGSSSSNFEKRSLPLKGGPPHEPAEGLREVPGVLGQGGHGKEGPCGFCVGGLPGHPVRRSGLRRRGEEDQGERELCESRGRAMAFFVPFALILCCVASIRAQASAGTLSAWMPRGRRYYRFCVVGLDLRLSHEPLIFPSVSFFPFFGIGCASLGFRLCLMGEAFRPNSLPNCLFVLAMMISVGDLDRDGFCMAWGLC